MNKTGDTPVQKTAAEGWAAGALARLRSDLNWTDLLCGVTASLLIAVLLQGFQFQMLPEYRVGDIASENVRADRDLVYVDVATTEGRRTAARMRTRAVYDLDGKWIAEQRRRISLSFNTARRILTEQKVPQEGRLSRAQQTEALSALRAETEETLAPEFLPLLLEQRFNPALEERILRVLDSVLRSGIVADPKEFQQDLQSGIVIRDNITLNEWPLGDSTRIRDLDSARDYLRQLHLEFAELPAPARVHLLDWLDTFVGPTLTLNARETETRRAAAAARVLDTEIQIKKGKVIVRAGEEVTDRAVQDLDALRTQRRPRPIAGQLAGLFFFVAALAYSLWRYFLYYRKQYRRIRRSALLALVALVLTAAVVRFLTLLADVVREQLSGHWLQSPFDLYAAIPFAFGAMLVTLLLDLRTGLIVSMMAGVLSGLLYGDVYASVYVLMGSIAGVFSIKKFGERSVLFRCGLTIGTVNALTLAAIHLARQEQFAMADLLPDVIIGMISGILGAALTATLLPGFESLFRMTTDVRLLELSNLNSPALRRLSVEAPGTYHHSLMVGTLAEAAARAIGANPLLAQVGAYYHDLGKVFRPEYFGENRPPGESPHAGLPPNQSCEILAGHVADGLKLARRAGLPETVRDMIPQHHGTRIMSYFYQKARAKGGDVGESEFRYPGPRPRTKEAAVLMMADSIEAASRTLEQPSVEEIRGMIDRLVKDILDDGQFDECDITLHEIRSAKESFLQVLNGIYHHRIVYPGYDFKIS